MKEHVAQTFKEITNEAYAALVKENHHPETRGTHLHVTAPWTWHRHGKGWQFYLSRSNQSPLHFYEDEHGTLHLD